MTVHPCRVAGLHLCILLDNTVTEAMWLEYLWISKCTFRKLSGYSRERESRKDGIFNTFKFRSAIFVDAV